MKWVLYLTMALLVVASLPTPALSQEYGFRLEPLTVSSDYASLDVVGDAVVAVGKSGLMTVWRPNRVFHVTVTTSDLASVSCAGSTCVAVGKGGVVSEFDMFRETYVTRTLFGKDLVSVAFDGSTAVIASADELFFYKPKSGGEVAGTYRPGAKIYALTFSEGAFIGIAEKSVFLVTPSAEVKKVSDYASTPRAAFKNMGSVWALLQDGLYMDGKRVLQGLYTAAAPHPRGVLLLSGTVIQLYDALDGQVRQVSTVTRAVTSIRLYPDGRVAASGPSGTLLLVGPGERLLTAPAGDYVDAVSDGSGGVWFALKNGLILRYLNNSFTTYAVGDQPIALAYSGGHVAVLGSRWLWRLIPSTGEVVKVEAALRGSDFSDVAPSSRSGYWVTLVGQGRIVDVDLDGDMVPTNVAGKLLSVTRGYAVGEKLAVSLPQVKVSKQNDTLTAVDVTSCGAVAVSDKGRIAYLKPDKVDSFTVPNAAFRSVSVNPRGAYALAAGSKGGFVVFDGYKTVTLPTRLPDTVVAIAWVDDKTAVVLTPKAAYRLVETSAPEPQIEVTAPKSMEVFTGTSRKIQVEVRPLHGMSGEVELYLSSTNPQIILQQTSLSLKLSPMCTAKAEIGVSIPPETPEGSGSITVSYKGLNLATTSLALKRPGQQPQQATPPLPAYLMQYLPVLAAVAAIMLVVRMAVRGPKARGR